MIPHISHIYDTIAAERTRFVTIFFAVVFVTYAFLYVIDFIPEAPAAEATDTTAADTSEMVAPTAIEAVPVTGSSVQVVAPARTVAALPELIIFDTLDKEVAVLNPESREIADLDAALLNGVVRHPDSADFQNPGNIFILGHSSYLPNVINKNFQAFNGIQKLTWGDTISVRSADTEYVYRVDKVYEAKASEVTVPVDTDTPKLTLATCDSFGSTDDRFIVEASLVSERALN